MKEKRKTYRIDIGGTVQGVGFRPFLHRLARTYGLGGRAWNSSGGVRLMLTASVSELSLILNEIEKEAPRLARVKSIACEETCLEEYEDFLILPSQRQSESMAGVSPDICVCGDCLKELFDPGDRRYLYPFINCTNCGPRFTIIRSVPYDRGNTSMSAFEMCDSCAGEYHDIEDRRYHAQPDCCEACGPGVFFLDKDENDVLNDAIETAREYLKSGRIIAVKGLGGIHLACEAFDAKAVARLRELKRRDERPFAIMCADIGQASMLCEISPAEAELLQSPKRPITLLKKKDESLSHCSENAYLGIMLPYTPLHYLLTRDMEPLVMTSANLSERPIFYKNADALKELYGLADGFLLHNREIHVPCDDSLLFELDGAPYFIRRSRGFVPEGLSLPLDAGTALACGAEQKASFAFSKGNSAYLSQHIGDLKNLETLELYERMTRHFSSLFDIRAACVACDMHPDYLSTAFAEKTARQNGLPLYRIQHHHAHMASCMADNGLNEPCIGVIWDGTGYGTDGKTWGGEFFTGDYSSVKRAGSIRPLLLAGGDAAIKEIYRVACALALDAEEELPDICAWPESEAVKKLLELKLNVPASSGMGRLFDGVYSLITGRKSVSYEGQGAVLLEAAAKDGENGEYPYEIYLDEGRYTFDHRPVIKSLIKEKRNGADNGLIAARFMNTLVKMALEVCIRLRQESGLKRVVLSGGVFLNRYILIRLCAALDSGGFRVYHHSRVSANDEGIALGQLMIAAALREGS